MRTQYVRSFTALLGIICMMTAIMISGQPSVSAAPLASLTQTAEPPTRTNTPTAIPTATPTATVVSSATPELPVRPSSVPTATATATATTEATATTTVSAIATTAATDTPPPPPPPADEGILNPAITPTNTRGPIQIEVVLIPSSAALARQPTEPAPTTLADTDLSAPTEPALIGQPAAPNPAPPAELPNSGAARAALPIPLLLLGLTLIGLSLGLRRIR
jgi:hypothetical protein